MYKAVGGQKERMSKLFGPKIFWVKLLIRWVRKTILQSFTCSPQLNHFWQPWKHYDSQKQIRELEEWLSDMCIQFCHIFVNFVLYQWSLKKYEEMKSAVYLVYGRKQDHGSLFPNLSTLLLVWHRKRKIERTTQDIKDPLIFLTL